MTRAQQPRGRVVVLGALANRPFGGMTWQVLHHLEGFRRLGFDVWYVEDTDTPVLDPVTLGWTPALDANLAFLCKWLECVDMTDRWVVRPPGSQTEVLGALDDIDDLAELYRNADAVFNLCGSHEVNARLADATCLVLMETDPGEVQIDLARGQARALRESGRHVWRFTYGTNLGNPDCRLPTTEHTWYPTVPPVVVDWWADPAAAVDPMVDEPFTSVLRWRHDTGAVTWGGEQWAWTKHRVFERFIDLPSKIDVPLLLAVRMIDDDDVRRLLDAGWIVEDAAELDDPAAYRDFIRRSRGEFSITKDRYVVPRTGWFSDRSVCYLAAGRPVVVHETGLVGVPTGTGIVTFTDVGDAADGVMLVADDYERHARAASDLAREHFDASRVLGDVCRTMGLL